MAKTSVKYDTIEKKLALCIETLELLSETHNYALPKFNWGASALDAKAIGLLNRSGQAISSTLVAVTGHQPKVKK